MSDEEPGTEESTADRPEHAMTDDTDDDEFEQADIENGEPEHDAHEGRTEDEVMLEGEEAAEEEEVAEDEESATNGASESRISDDLRRQLNYALLLGLGLLALIAVIQFYLNMSAVINQWVTREFRSLFQAIFNLVVLLVVGAAISLQVKRLAE